MDRPLPKPDLSRTDPPILTQPSEPEPDVSSAPATPPRAARAWRLVILLWVTAFGFLAAYEMLYAVFKLLHIRER
jgi:hypothetical protein